MTAENIFDFLPIDSSDPWLLITEKQAKHLLYSDDPPLVEISEFNFPPFESSSPIFPNLFNFDHFCERLADSANYFFLQAKLQKEIGQQVSFTNKEEMKRFLGVVCFMNEYRFPQYLDHFIPKKNSHFISPIPQIMDISRFNFFTKFIELSIDEKSSNKYFELYNSFLESFQMLNQLSPKKTLFLLIKKIASVDNLGGHLMLLYDDDGFLLKGSMLRLEDMDFEVFTKKIFLFLQQYEGSQQTLIINQEMIDFSLLEFLQLKLHFKIMSLVILDKEDPRDFSIMPGSIAKEESKKKSLYCYNKKNYFLIMKNEDYALHKSMYILLGLKNGLGCELKIMDPFKEACLFMRKIEEKIDNLWNISIWKDFEQEQINLALEPIFFIFSSFLNNSFLLSSGFSFTEFKESFIKKLLGETKCFQGNHSFDEGIGEGHFPEKVKHCKICKVCKKNPRILKPKKSQYVCELCTIHFKKHIALCVTPCFKIYHSNPERFNERRNVSKKKKERQDK